MVAYISIRSGPETGHRFQLDPDRPLHIGRAANCDILLTDAVSSRFHAVLYYEDDHWQIRDNKSRNGTSVNGQKTDHATLQDFTVVRIGSTELQFLEVDEELVIDSLVTQSIVLDRPLGTNGGQDLSPLDPIQEAAQTGNLLDLYQLSIQLFGSTQPNEVIDTAGALLRSRTGAHAVGLFRLGASKKLVCDFVTPTNAIKILTPDREVLKRVMGQQEAVWVCEDFDPNDEQSSRGKDAIFVPLIVDDEAEGMLVLHRDKGQFDEAGFELAIAASRLLAVALAVTRKSYQAQAENRRLADRNAEADELIGNCSIMTRLKERIDRIGKANGCVLIRGESGAGKELVARAVHRSSLRRDHPMLSVNCAAIPRDLMESQLFGHKKGAFTGAENDHTGWFQQAHTGTLFLDEVGELTLEGQAKLLRVLEGHPFLPVGATEEVRVDVRVVAATNRDLAEFVREKRFREDLYYRLSVFELIVPPLRERGEDIELLVNHFLEHFRLRHGRPSIELSASARKRLLEYHWPGNVRQLRNVIDSAIVMADGEEIQPEDLGLRDAGTGQIDSLRLDFWEERLIREALERTEGNVPDAAQLLGISRATAYRKIAEYEILR
jgi:transcriptional regulator with GAF, ATPase, and Fis domain